MLFLLTLNKEMLVAIPDANIPVQFTFHFLKQLLCCFNSWFCSFDVFGKEFANRRKYLQFAVASSAHKAFYELVKQSCFSFFFPFFLGQIMVNQILVDYLQLKVTSPAHKDNFYKSYKTVENSQNFNLG